MIMSVARALELERPVVMGCSIGGRIVLNLALKHARELRALIGLQSAAYVERYYDASWLDHAEVHGGRACGGLAYGLMSPLSPEEHKWETVWHYMQGGPGVFSGDLFFYQVEGDIRSPIGAIGTKAAIDYFNEKGGVMGYKINAIFADAQSKVDVAINEMTRLYDQEKVDLVAGLYSSAQCVPMAQQADARKKFLWINVCVASSVMEDKKFQYVFRPTVHSDQYGAATCSYVT